MALLSYLSGINPAFLRVIDDGQSIAESESVVTPDRDEFADDEQLYRLPIAASSDPEWNDGGNIYGVRYT